jgi:hypothetical protein
MRREGGCAPDGRGLRGMECRFAMEVIAARLSSIDRPIVSVGVHKTTAACWIQ